MKGLDPAAWTLAAPETIELPVHRPARILLFVVPIVMWLIVFPLLGLNVDIRIGS